MKSSPSHKFQSFILALGFFTISAFTAQPANANTNLNLKRVFYNGEWITRIAISEINIVANRIPKNDIVPFLKNVETVYENGVKTLHITLNEINISAAGNSSDGFEIMVNEDEEEFLPINEMIPTIVAPNQSETNPVITTEEKNNHKISYKYKTGEAAKFSKRPVFNRIVNKLVNAGIEFLMKINDGLFFKS